MLKDFVDKKHCLFVDEVSDWEEAIRKCCIPIIEDGTVTEAYPGEIIRCVKEYGPYIVLIPGVAMPHSQEGGDMVKKTTISFMKLQKPVVFDESDPDSYADLFFTLASCNPDDHLKDMQELSALLENEDLVEEMHGIKDENDLLRLAEKYNL